MILEGKSWKFGHNVDTDVITPGKYLFGPIEQLKTHVLEVLNPQFAGEVRTGDILVAGQNFGCGSSREQAPKMLKLLGVSVVLAQSFSRIFYRNCIAIGLPVLAVNGLWEESSEGDIVRADLVAGEATNVRSGVVHIARPIPERMLRVLQDGGIIPALKRIAAADTSDG